MSASVTVLGYSDCSTCKKATKWLDAAGVKYTYRPIVDEPPTLKELAAWIPASGLDVKKWLNTSGQSYRAIGKAKVDAASSEELVRWLAADGKLVKRPVLVAEAPKNALLGDRVLVGFKEDAYAALFAR